MKVLWHCEDRAGPAMAGPAIRAVELSRRLVPAHQVTLACPGATTLREVPAALQLVELQPGESLRAHLGSTDALIAQGFGFPFGDLLRLPGSARLVLDLYDPVLLELLARAGPTPSAEERLHLTAVRWRLLWMLGRADHVLCASERQRAFWLGWLGAAGRLVPELLAQDPEARSLLAVVPFGIDSIPPDGAGPQPITQSTNNQSRDGDLVVLWWGGLWDWMDSVTAVRAIARLRRDGVPARLVLPAGNRPGADPMPAAGLAEQEARALGLWGDGVTQLPAWVPYAERGALLRSAAVAVSCHRPSLEAELAYRTRLLDCVWAGLPVVATAGDELSARAEREGWARTIPPGNEAALAAALRGLLEPGEQARAREAAARAAPGHLWERSSAALLDLLARPAPARLEQLPAIPPELRGADPASLARAAARKLLARMRRWSP